MSRKMVFAMELQAMRQLYEISEIPMCLAQEGQVLLSLPELESPVFTPRFLELCRMDYRIYAQTHTGPLLLMLNPGYYLGIQELKGGQLLVLGPAVLEQFSWKELQPWMASPLFADNRSTMGRLLMSQKPASEKDFFHTFALAFCLVTGETADPGSFSTVDAGEVHREIQPSLTQYMFDARESEGFHTPYSWEIQLSRAVENGSLEQLKQLRLHQQTGRLGVLSRNADRQVRYMFVTTVAVFSRAALRGGLNYERAYSIADIYCQRMDAMSDVREIELLQTQMIEQFCREVANLKDGRYTPAVRRCSTYIRQHSHEKITLDILAEECGMSTRRLSEKFKKETGSSVVDYIHRVKMEEAESLLQDSEFSVGEISNYLGYSNQSHFISVFRRFYGMTPMQYRNSHS